MAWTDPYFQAQRPPQPLSKNALSGLVDIAISLSPLVVACCRVVRMRVYVHRLLADSAYLRGLSRSPKATRALLIKPHFIAIALPHRNGKTENRDVACATNVCSQSKMGLLSLPQVPSKATARCHWPALHVEVCSHKRLTQAFVRSRCDGAETVRYPYHVR